MTSRSMSVSVVLAGVLFLAVGCSRGDDRRLLTPERYDHGLTVVLPGIEGNSHLNRGIRDGLASGGLPTAIIIRDWTLGPMLAVANQMLESRARSQGQQLAAEIMAYRDLHPGKPVFLVAHSGGSAVAIFTAEAMPRDAGIDAIVMLAPSVSPDYDLTGCLQHVDGQLYNYYSAKDRALLGMGTWVLGTMDREHSESAGLTGFKLPKPAGPETMRLYRKLVQKPWEPKMQLSGNPGGHTDWANPQFVRDFVAPVLRREMEEAAERAAEQAKPAAGPAT